jgi:hypothetical protein
VNAPEPATTSTIDMRVDDHSEVRVTARLWENRKAVNVEVKLLPGGGWWRCPDTRTLRRIVDRLISPHGLERSESRREVNTHPGWMFVYPVRETEER